MKDENQYRDDIYLKAKNDFGEKLSESEITLCIMTEEHEGLSFFHNHIWPARRMNKLKWEKTIDGFRVLAARNGLCRIDEPEWIYDKDFTHADKSRMHPQGLYACKVAIYRRSPRGAIEGPFVGVAHYHEFVQLKKDGSVNRQWKTMPKNQLAAAAERQALRKAGLDHRSDVISDIVDTEPPTIVEDEPPVVEDEPPEREDMGAHSSDEPEDVEPPEQSDAGKLAVISMPSDGWRNFDLLDDGRRILLMRKKDSTIRMALDDGHALEVRPIGENKAQVLTDELRKDYKSVPLGGFEWDIGSQYYDGKLVTKVKKGKQEDTLILLLDNGYKVKLGRYGKELSRKKAKSKAKKDDVDTSTSSPAEGERPSRQGRLEPAFKLTAEERVAFDLGIDGYDGPLSDAELKMNIKPLLQRYCKEFNGGVRLSPKEGYTKLTGVVLNQGQKMSNNDLEVFLEALAEALSKKGVAS